MALAGQAGETLRRAEAIEAPGGASPAAPEPKQSTAVDREPPPSGNGEVANRREDAARRIADLDAGEFFRRGRRLLRDGNAGAAQLLLERAAELGSGEAAFDLATTYDGTRNAESPGAPLLLNIALARRWYERAAELGVAEARERLSALEQSSHWEK